MQRMILGDKLSIGCSILAVVLSLGSAQTSTFYMKAGAGDWSASANFYVDVERTQVAPHAPQAKDIVYLISGATFEPNGIIDLMNLQSSEVGALPGDYVGCTGLDNLGTWQVTRDGRTLVLEDPRRGEQADGRALGHVHLRPVAVAT